MICALLLVLWGTTTVSASSVSAADVETSSISALVGPNGISITSATFEGSLLLYGSSGTILTQSSAVASSFFGDGSQLALPQMVVLTGTQTFSGANTFISSFAVQSNGRDIIFSTAPQTTNIRITAEGVISFSPTIHNSSSTSVPEYATTASSFTECIPGSTITVVTGGGRLAVTFSGTLTPTSQNTGRLNFLVDGAYVNDMSFTSGIILNNSSRNWVDSSFSYLTPALPAGSHSVCLMLAKFEPVSSASTVTLDNNSTRGNAFYITEIR